MVYRKDILQQGAYRIDSRRQTSSTRNARTKDGELYQKHATRVKIPSPLRWLDSPGERCYDPYCQY